MKFKDWLSLDEVHYSDTYGPKFDEFRKKYLKQKNDTKLFVQFTDYADDPLNRVAYHDPNHNDPVGVYAYPLKYVLDYPADIWYGAASKYLRVIRLKSKNVVHLQNMENWWAKSLLNKADISAYTYMDLSQKAFKHAKGKGQIGKQFFHVIQYDLDKPPSVETRLFSKPQKVYTQRTPAEQTALLRKMGIEVLIDNATTPNQAVINSREPNQAIFLTPSSFKIEDVFYMGDKEKNVKISRMSFYNDRILRKLAQKIAELMNDKIKERHDRSSKSSATQEYFTVKGRAISISILLPSWYTNTRKIGEKKHKEFQKYDPYEIHVEIYGERGRLKNNYGRIDTFDEIAKRVVSTYLDQDIDPNFKPATLASSKAAELAADEERAIRMRQKEKEEVLSREKDYQPHIQAALDRVNINLKLSPNKLWFANLISFHRSANPKNISKEQLANSIDEIIKNGWKIYEILAKNNDELFLSKNDPDSKKFIDFYKQLLLKTNIMHSDWINIPEIEALK